jgi:sugar lactone lactonase YvrE
VTEQGADKLAVLNIATGRMVAQVRTGMEPDAVAVTPDGHLAVVANLLGGTITPVDLRTTRALPAIAVGGHPDAVAVGGPRGSTALVADLQGASVTPVDLTTLTAGRPIDVGVEPDAIAVSADGRLAFVANFGDNTVSVLDVDAWRLLQTLDIGFGPTGMAVASASDGRPPTVWVSGGSSIVPIAVTGPDPEVLTVGPPIDVRRPAEAIALAGGGMVAWVADQDARVTPVDLSTGSVGRPVYVGGRPSAIVIAAPRK